MHDGAFRSMQICVASMSACVISDCASSYVYVFEAIANQAWTFDGSFSSTAVGCLLIVIRCFFILHAYNLNLSRKKNLLCHHIIGERN